MIGSVKKGGLHVCGLIENGQEKGGGMSGLLDRKRGTR